MPNSDIFFTLRGGYVNGAIITLIRLEIGRRTRWWCLKCVLVYLARDNPAFVMYCVNGASDSSLLLESTDSMIRIASWPSVCEGSPQIQALSHFIYIF